MATSQCNCNRKNSSGSSPYPSSSSDSQSNKKVFKEFKETPPSAFRDIILHQFLPLPSLPNPTSPVQPTFTCSCSSSLLSFKHTLNSSLSSAMCPSKRVYQDACDSSDSDQRFKRLIKNRESGARSRARKYAYKNELETKLALLMEENSRLRRQIEELEQRFKSSGGAKPSKMRTLYRTSTSPF